MKNNELKQDSNINPKFESRCEICEWYLGNKECCAFKGKIPENVWKYEHKEVLNEQEVNIVFSKKGDVI